MKRCASCRKNKALKNHTLCGRCVEKLIYSEYNGVQSEPVTVSEPEPTPEVKPSKSEEYIPYKLNNDGVLAAARNADALGLSYGEYMARKRAETKGGTIWKTVKN